jgi:hypothetical protein
MLKDELLTPLLIHLALVEMGGSSSFRGRGGGFAGKSCSFAGR